MDINELITNANAERINITVTLNDLREFAKSLVSETKRQLQTIVEEEKQDRLLTRKETAQMLKVSLPTLWRWEASGILVPTRIGKSVCYSSVDVHRIIREGTAL